MNTHEHVCPSAVTPPGHPVSVPQAECAAFVPTVLRVLRRHWEVRAVAAGCLAGLRNLITTSYCMPQVGACILAHMHSATAVGLGAGHGMKCVSGHLLGSGSWMQELMVRAITVATDALNTATIKPWPYPEYMEQLFALFRNAAGVGNKAVKVRVGKLVHPYRLCLRVCTYPLGDPPPLMGACANRHPDPHPCSFCCYGLVYLLDSW